MLISDVIKPRVHFGSEQNSLLKINMKYIMRNKSLLYLIFGFIIFIGKYNSQELLYPDIPSNTISDVTFVNDSTGYFVTRDGSIYITNDGGNSWNIQRHYQRNNLSQIEFVSETEGFIYSPYAFNGDDISFLYSSENSWDFWNKADIDIGYVETFLPISKSKIIKSDDYGKILMLDNFYKEWDTKYQMPLFQGGCLEIPYGKIIQFHKFSNQRILALCNSEYAKNDLIIQDSVSFILESIDEGNEWDTLWIGLSDLMYSFTFANDSLGWMVGESSDIYHTTNGGQSWVIQFSDSSSQEYYNLSEISTVDSENIYSISTNNKVLISNDGGSSWRKEQPDLSNNYYNRVEAINNNSGVIFGKDFLKTNDNGSSWERVSNSLKVDFSKIDFVSEKLGWGIGSLGILKTIDGGRSWKVQYENESIYGTRYIHMIDSLNGWAILDENLLNTQNGWDSWNITNFTSDTRYMRGITFLNNDVGVIFELRKFSTNSVYNLVTTDGGESWQEYLLEAENQETGGISSFTKMKFTGNDHLWFVNQQGVWLSRDTAKTWSIIDSNITCLSGFDFYDSLTAMVAVSQNRMAFTNDGCKTWEYVENPYSFQTNDIEIVGQTMQGLLSTACGYDGTIVNYYYDNGNFDFVYNLISFTNNPFFDVEVFIKDKRPNIWWAGNGSTIVYRLSEYLVTDIKDEYSPLPQIFSLSQNYPNPFNPSTVINYSLAKSGFVELKVYDILGREVASLVEEKQSIGNYKIEFNASSLSSGIYFYRLQCGDFSETKKLILLR